MKKDQLINEIQEIAFSKGADIVGFADLRDLPEELQTGFPFGISIAVALDPAIISKIIEGPTEEYYQEYTRVNTLLNSIGETVSGFLCKQGYKAVYPSATDTAIDSGEKSTITDMTTLSAPLSHKMVATRAGIGWIGKNDLLITPGYGSAVRLISVLTDAELPAGTPKNNAECGICNACVAACPAGCLTGEEWYPGIARDVLVDVHRCRETARELTAEKFGKPVAVCGVCIAVCPWTQKYLNNNK